MDLNEFEINDSSINTEQIYSDEIEFLVTQLNGIVHAAGRYSRSVQLPYATFILKGLEKIRLKKEIEMKHKTKLEYLVEALDALPVDGVLSKVNFIKERWGEYNFFTSRSFDVFFSKAKQKLPNKEFCGKFNKLVKRIS